MFPVWVMFDSFQPNCEGYQLAVSRAGILQPVVLHIAEVAAWDHPAHGTFCCFLYSLMLYQQKDPPFLSPHNAN